MLATSSCSVRHSWFLRFIITATEVVKFISRNQQGWYDFYTGKFQAGRVKKMVDAPYERIPLFVRAGSIVPFGPEIQYTDEKQAEHIKLYVYQGADAAFTLYEDEGVNYNYEQGVNMR